MYCPNCKTEYREGFAVCADCGAELTRELEVEEEGDYELVYADWQYLTSAFSDVEISIITGMLEGEGIPVNKMAEGVGAFSRAYMGQSRSLGAKIFVPKECLEKAKEVIEGYEPPAKSGDGISGSNINGGRIFAWIAIIFLILMMLFGVYNFWLWR